MIIMMLSLGICCGIIYLGYIGDGDYYVVIVFINKVNRKYFYVF